MLAPAADGGGDDDDAPRQYTGADSDFLAYPSPLVSYANETISSQFTILPISLTIYICVSMRAVCHKTKLFVS